MNILIIEDEIEVISGILLFIKDKNWDYIKVNTNRDSIRSYNYNLLKLTPKR